MRPAGPAVGAAPSEVEALPLAEPEADPEEEPEPTPEPLDPVAVVSETLVEVDMVEPALLVAMELAPEEEPVADAEPLAEPEPVPVPEAEPEPVGEPDPVAEPEPVPVGITGVLDPTPAGTVGWVVTGAGSEVTAVGWPVTTP